VSIDARQSKANGERRKELKGLKEFKELKERIEGPRIALFLSGRAPIAHWAGHGSPGTRGGVFA